MLRYGQCSEAHEQSQPGALYPETYRKQAQHETTLKPTIFLFSCILFVFHPTPIRNAILGRFYWCYFLAQRHSLGLTGVLSYLFSITFTFNQT